MKSRPRDAGALIGKLAVACAAAVVVVALFMPQTAALFPGASEVADSVRGDALEAQRRALDAAGAAAGGAADVLGEAAEAALASLPGRGP